MAKIEIAAFCAGIIIGVIAAGVFFIALAVADENGKRRQSSGMCRYNCELIEQYGEEIQEFECERQYYKSSADELSVQNRKLLQILEERKNNDED